MTGMGAYKHLSYMPFNMVSPAYDTAAPENCVLIIQSGKESTLAFVIAKQEGELLLVKKWQLSEDKRDNIILWLKRDEHLNKAFAEVDFVCRREQFSLYPKEFSQFKQSLFALQNRRDTKVNASTNKLSGIDGEILFEYSMELFEYLKSKYMNTALIHSAKLFLDCIFKLDESEDSIWLNVTDKLLEIAVTTDRRFVFYNMFQFKTSEDLLYYILLVKEEAFGAEANCPVYCFGEIEETSALLKLLNKYIQRFYLGNEQFERKVIADFKGVPSHFYYPLLSKYLKPAFFFALTSDN